MTAIRLHRTTPIIAAALAATTVGIAGGLLTDLSPWYYSLRSPSWKPPDWLFGPAWTAIFACAALSGLYAWTGSRRRADHARILTLFGVNAALNILWSVLFFRLHRPDWALVEVVFPWVSILALILGLARYSRAASWLLAPYLAWVSFAAVLNLAIVQLNGPFN